MNCPECNENNVQRKQYDKYGSCGCCNGKRKVSFNRYVQYQLGWVCWLNDNASGDASVDEMNDRCRDIVRECFYKYHKSRLPILEDYIEYDSYDDTEPSVVMYHYARQFKGSDCLAF